MNFTLLCSLYLGVLLSGSLATASSAWEKVGDFEGITSYRRLHRSDSLYEFRALGQVDGTMEEVVATLTDVSLQSEWIEGSLGVRFIEGNFFSGGDAGIGDYYQIVYGRQAILWPFDDRDYILRSHFEVVKNSDHALSQIVIRSRAIQHARVPESDDYVRVDQMNVEIILKQEHRRVLFDFRVLANPAGMIPDWIVNILSDQVPRNTILNVRRLVKEKKFSHGKLETVESMFEREFKAH